MRGCIPNELIVPAEAKKVNSMNQKVDFHKVRIFPKGLNVFGETDEKDVIWLKFNSMEEKDQYVTDEFLYCKKEEDAYLTAFYKKDRIAAKNALYKKRVQYARGQGFGGRGKIWTRAYRADEMDGDAA